jgi:hypothetical protein
MSGSSYYSHNDLRLHFGLAQAETVGKLEIDWPSGAKTMLEDIRAGQIITIEEGRGIVKAEPYKR